MFGIFSIIFLLLVFIVYVAFHFPDHHQAPPSSYRKRSRVMNASEEALYWALQGYLGGQYIILSKVRMEDFIDVVSERMTRNELWSWRGRIKSRHVDFLICDKTTTEPLMAIELDGNSHHRQDRMARDQFVNNVYSGSNLDIKHIKVGADFESEVKKIKDDLEMGKAQQIHL